MKIIINQKQKKLLVESQDEFLKNFLIKNGLDFTNKISIIQSSYDIPLELSRVSPPEYTRSMLNFYGPMFLIDIEGEELIYQDRGDHEWFMGKNGFIYNLYEIPKLEKFFALGLKFSKIIDLLWEDDFY